MMRNAGLLEISDPEGPTQRCDTFTCRHCNKVVFVPVKASPTDLGGLCGHCGSLVCPTCVDKGTCTPFEETLFKQFQKYEALKSYGVI